MSFLLLVALFAATITSVFAQTFTNCQPLNKTCPPDPALGTSHLWHFNQTQDDKIWNNTNGDIDFTDNGAHFSISKRLESPTLQSNFYIFFGVVETHMRMSAGRGIVSSVVLQSDDLDEIDWEWIGYNTSSVQTNYYGKGVADYHNMDEFYVPNADSEFHNYTTHWTQEKLEWWIDGNLARTLTYDDAEGGKRYPQTPSNVRIGIWPAGDPQNAQGTIDWAGGEVNYDAGPYTMIIEKVRVHDFHTGKEYKYTDQSGDFDSIKVIEGNSTAVHEINKPPPKSLQEKWDDLSSGAKAGVGIGAAAVVITILALFATYFYRQRRKGRLERALGDTQYGMGQTEMNNYNDDWRQSEWRRSGYQPVR